MNEKRQRKRQEEVMMIILVFLGLWRCNVVGDKCNGGQLGNHPLVTKFKFNHKYYVYDHTIPLCVPCRQHNFKASLHIFLVPTWILILISSFLILIFLFSYTPHTSLLTKHIHTCSLRTRSNRPIQLVELLIKLTNKLDWKN